MNSKKLANLRLDLKNKAYTLKAITEIYLSTKKKKEQLEIEYKCILLAIDKIESPQTEFDFTLDGEL